MSEDYWNTRCDLARIYYNHLEDEIIQEANRGIFRAKRAASTSSSNSTNSTLATYDQYIFF